MWTLLQITLTIFGTMDPPGNIPPFLALTGGLDQKERRRVGTRAVFWAAGIVLLFVLAGRVILDMFSISIESFRISGGLVLVLIGLQIIFEFGSGGFRMKREEGVDMSMVPLATPLLAGPGTITLAIVLSKEFGYLLTLSGMAINLGLTWLVFRYSDVLLRKLGRSGTTALAKVMGIILVSIGVEMIRKSF